MYLQAGETWRVSCSTVARKGQRWGAILPPRKGSAFPKGRSGPLKVKTKVVRATDQLMRMGCYGIPEGGAPSLRAGESQPGSSVHGRKAEMLAGRRKVGLSAMVYT